MLRRLGIRSKVLAVLAVPMLVVLLAGVFISFEAVRDLRDARTARQVVDLVATYVPFNAALNDERVASLTGADAEDLAAARSATDAALGDFQDAAEATDLGRYSGLLQPRLDEVLRQLSTDLPTIRANVDNAQLRVVGTAYTTFVTTQLELVDAAANEMTDRSLATYLAAYASVGRTADALAQEYVAGVDLLGRTQDSPAAGQSFATLASQTELLRGGARTAVDDLAITGLALPTRDPSAAFTQIRTVLSTGNVAQMAAVSPNTYRLAFTEQNDSFRQVADGALSESAGVANRAISAAWQRTALTVGLVVLAAAASLILALVVSRAIVVPLRRLTAAATDLREELPRLIEQVQVPGDGPQLGPPQIPVTSRDEVGRLASAFNAVNATTVQVAQEQAALRGSIAEMFVNVARRDQVLLNRQLSFIDSLERTEEDPQALANLFRLDHLATRMRRNAESLLVLAGIDSGRRLRDALPLSDVVRTASSEIEQYDRVQLDLQADPHMLGFNALPAAHLIAELLENATVFSEPETPVVVTTAVSGPYVEVRIVDEGLGMSEAELAAANEKIAATSAGDALGAQRLGLFVVGRLAQRLSAEVVLRKSRHATTGTETVVRFPATLFQSTEASPLGAYGADAAAVADAPVVDEVDLAALTDGTTSQGLPRRRMSGAAPDASPTRLPARSHGFDEDSIVLPPVAAPDAMPADLSATSPDWAPVVQSDGPSGLPSRTPAAAASTEATPAPGSAPAVDPAARAGMFAGFFRGRGEVAAAQSAASDEAAETPVAPAAERTPAHGAAEGLPFVVPGLMPEDEPGTWGVTDPYETQQGTPPAWAFDNPVPTVAAWPAGVVEPAFALPDEAGAPFDAAPAAEAEPPLGAEGEVGAPAGTPSEPAWAADVPATESTTGTAAGTAWPSWAAMPASTGDFVPAPYQPVQPAPVGAAVDSRRLRQVADEAPSAPVQDEAAVVEPWTPPALQPWSAPATDTGQWPVVAEQAPVAEDAVSAFPDVADWGTGSGFGPGDDAPYAPFERTLDEARAWATGSIPRVTDELAAQRHTIDAPEAVPGPDVAEPGPEPAAEPDWAAAWSGAQVPVLEPDVAAPLADPVAEPVADGTTPFAPAVQVPGAFAETAAPVVEPATALTLPETEPEAPVRTPAWGAIAPAATTGSFAELVRDEPAEPKKRRGLFGRRPKEPKQETSAPVLPPTAPARSSAWAPSAVPPPMPAPPTIVTTPPPRPVPVAPAAESVVGSTDATDAPVAPVPQVPVSPAAAGWAPQSSWNPPAAATLPDGPAGATWSPPDWAPRPAAATSDAPEPAVSSVPSSGTHIGTLDDEVAAMLALRSDIQEQALSELSQLSAYRPQVVQGSERLTRRVPAAVPEAAPDPTADPASGVERDPEELRSRLASFQSGTARGRRDADREPGATE